MNDIIAEPDPLAGPKPLGAVKAGQSIVMENACRHAWISTAAQNSQTTLAATVRVAAANATTGQLRRGCA